jgi:hypothetical protein
VEKIRNILRATDSQKEPGGTFRQDFGLDKMRNIADASDSKDAAEKEIARFFHIAFSLRNSHRIWYARYLSSPSSREIRKQARLRKWCLTA